MPDGALAIEPTEHPPDFEPPAAATHCPAGLQVSPATQSTSTLQTEPQMPLPRSHSTGLHVCETPDESIEAERSSLHFALLGAHAAPWQLNPATQSLSLAQAVLHAVAPHI